MKKLAFRCSNLFGLIYISSSIFVYSMDFFLHSNLHENLFILHHAEKESLELIDPEEDDEHHYDEHDEDHEDHGGHDDHDDDDADGEGGGNYTLA